MTSEGEPVTVLQDRLSCSLHAYTEIGEEINSKDSFEPQETSRLGCLHVFYRLTDDIAARDLTCEPPARETLQFEIIHIVGALDMARTGDFRWVKEWLSSNLDSYPERFAKRLKTLIGSMPEKGEPFIQPNYPWET